MYTQVKIGQEHFCSAFKQQKWCPKFFDSSLSCDYSVYGSGTSLTSTCVPWTPDQLQLRDQVVTNWCWFWKWLLLQCMRNTRCFQWVTGCLGNIWSSVKGWAFSLSFSFNFKLCWSFSEFRQSQCSPGFLGVVFQIKKHSTKYIHKTHHLMFREEEWISWHVAISVAIFSLCSLTRSSVPHSHNMHMHVIYCLQNISVWSSIVPFPTSCAIVCATVGWYSLGHQVCPMSSLVHRLFPTHQ